MIDTLIEEDPESATFDLVLNPEMPYITIDKKTGLLIRFFNIPKS